jgi:hypothetical protein
MGGTPMLVHIIYVCGSVCVSVSNAQLLENKKKKKTLRCVFGVGIK